MLIEAMLDLAGLDYDAPDRLLKLDPVLPGAWPHVGLTHKYPCGDVAYRLDRPIGGSVHRLTFQARLDYPVSLNIGVTCPGLVTLGPWHAHPEGQPPRHNYATGRVDWSVELPAGESSWAWAWG